MHKTVIGLAGRKGSGKSAVCNALVNHYGAKKSSFADPLKKMLQTLGLSEAQLWGNLKEVRDEKLLLGKTPRQAMQTLGTEWGRNHIHPDVWARAWASAIELNRPTLMVVEDVRFDNEVEAIRSVGGVVYGLERVKPPFWQSVREKSRFVHQSENFRQLVKRNNLVVIENTGTVEACADAVMLLAKEFYEQKREEAMSVRM